MNNKSLILAFVLSFAVFFGLSLLFHNHNNAETTTQDLTNLLLQAGIFSIVMTIFRVIGNKYAKKNESETKKSR